MFSASEIIPLCELEQRRSRSRALIRQFAPQAGGILIFSRINIYYLTGTYAIGCLWLPLDGDPILALRKGQARAALESPELKCISYRSFSNLAKIMLEAGSPLSSTLLAEQNALPWNMGLKLAAALKEFEIFSGDEIMRRARSLKTPFELERIKRACVLEARAIRQELPARMAAGQSEYELARELAHIFLDLGHGGPQRMYGQGAESFMSIVCVGTNSYYPGYNDVPTGFKGLHPATPYLGSPDTVWQSGQLLVADGNFVWLGYLADITQTFFSGPRQSAPKELLASEECLLQIQADCSALLKPGSTPEQIYRLSLDIAAKHGFAEGFMGLGEDKARFLGHGIGLLMDDWPPIAEGFVEPLEENMIVALEPKITLSGIGMPGIENTFLVTPQGGRSLTGVGEFIFIR